MSGAAIYEGSVDVAEAVAALAWAKQAEGLGADEILLTSTDRDGTRAGFDVELTAAGIQVRPV